MLRTLRLQNYRCFRDHTVTFQTDTVIVGKNNAGKSTIVEALHLLAAVVNRKASSFVSPPRMLELGKFQRGTAPKIAHLSINLQTAFHRHGDPPAILTATFNGGAIVTIYVHKEGIDALVRSSQGTVTTSNAFTNLNIPYIHILHQVGPLH
jgi:hypothetical protein